MVLLWRVDGALPLVILLAWCFPVAHVFDAMAELDKMVESLLKFTVQKCHFFWSCSNTSDFLQTSNYRPLTGQQYLCCSYCDCQKYCALGDFCCVDTFDFTDFGEYQTADVRDIVTKTYAAARYDELEFIYFEKYNTTDYNYIENIEITDILKRSSCTKVSLLSDAWEKMYFDGNYLINTCPETYPLNSETNLRCIGAVSGKEVADLTPETSVITSLSYTNKYCRQCNEPNSSSIPWEMRLYCLQEYSFQLPPLSSIQDLIEFDKSNPNCTISFQPSEDQRRIAFKPICLNVHVSSCNVSGKWESYDAAIELACETIYGPVMSSIKDFHYGDIVFQNIACFICNSNTEDTYGQPCEQGNLIIAPYGLQNAYASLITTHREDFGYIFLPNDDDISRTADTDSPYVCRVGEFYDESQGSCRESICPRDYRVNGEKCSPLYEYMNGISVEFKIKIKFGNNFFMSLISVMEEALLEAFTLHFERHQISFCTLSLWRKYTDSTKKEIDYFFYHAKIKTKNDDYFSNIRSSIKILVQGKEPFDVIADLNNNPVNYTVSFADEIVVHEMQSRTIVTDSTDDQSLQESSVNSKIETDSCPITISIRQSSFCERVVLKSDEFEMKSDKLIIKSGAYTVPIGLFDINGKNVLICTNELKKAFSRIRSDPSNTNTYIDGFQSEDVSLNFTFFVGIILTSVIISVIFFVASFFRKQCFSQQPRSHLTMRNVSNGDMHHTA